jgi:hypothetical protein
MCIEVFAELVDPGGQVAGGSGAHQGSIVAGAAQGEDIRLLEALDQRLEGATTIAADCVGVVCGIPDQLVPGDAV